MRNTGRIPRIYAPSIKAEGGSTERALKLAIELVIEAEGVDETKRQTVIDDLTTMLESMEDS